VRTETLVVRRQAHLSELWLQLVKDLVQSLLPSLHANPNNVDAFEAGEGAKPRELHFESGKVESVHRLLDVFNCGMWNLSQESER